MTLMKAKKPLALLLALLAALSLLGTTALAAGLPEETIAAQTELCGEDCGHTHEEVFSHTEHAEESLPEPEEIAVPVATPLLEQPEPEAEQPSDTSGVIRAAASIGNSTNMAGSCSPATGAVLHL